ncbi:hypothetical protein NPIL_58191 [Nephila pilipes]|uniref:Uncharacterized protein n=1 Tax=Nephila pilipes TaxID=299642 RepID=A0A8X6N4A7_NEPPI|nr:hypothetical protein NPIL_465311 [Nephila pilipes]GFT20224.1 hypothetical protein NPIL_58191 [Nephila pilipes]
MSNKHLPPAGKILLTAEVPSSVSPPQEKRVPKMTSYTSKHAMKTSNRWGPNGTKSGEGVIEVSLEGMRANGGRGTQPSMKHSDTKVVLLDDASFKPHIRRSFIVDRDK